FGERDLVSDELARVVEHRLRFKYDSEITFYAVDPRNRAPTLGDLHRVGHFARLQFPSHVQFLSRASLIARPDGIVPMMLRPLGDRESDDDGVRARAARAQTRLGRLKGGFQI